MGGGGFGEGEGAVDLDVQAPGFAGNLWLSLPAGPSGTESSGAPGLSELASTSHNQALPGG